MSKIKTQIREALAPQGVPVDESANARGKPCRIEIDFTLATEYKGGRHMPKTVKNTTDSIPAEADLKFAPIVRAFAGDKKISLGKMFGSVGLKTNGKVFAMLVKGTFVAKLPKERVADLVASTGAEYFDPGHGKLMKEWVALTGSEDLWINLAKEARRFVEGGKS